MLPAQKPPCQTSHKMPTYDNFISNIENAIIPLNDNEKNTIRTTSVNILTNFKNHKNRKPLNQELDKNIKETKKFLKQNPDLLILNADKTNKTVIMKDNEYDKKILDLLNDTNTYELLNKDPTPTFQKTNNELAKNLLNNEYINQKEYNYITCHNGLITKFYGLPKLHKKNIPPRPICAGYTSPNYNLSKFLCKILSPVVNANKYATKDSWELKNKIDDFSVPDNHVFFSLDVVSLYTNIPTDLVIKSITKHWNKIQESTKIPLKTFIDITEFVLNSTYFSYKNKYYKQKFGVAMGSPVSAVMTNLVMADLESSVISKNEKIISFYQRFVDDIIICANKDQIENIRNHFNNYNEHLQFTIELEKNNCINFLDITIIRQENGHINTNWYRKEIKNDRYLNFHSNASLQYKKSIIISLVDRAILLSSKKFHTQNLIKIKTILKKKSISHFVH